MDKNGDRIVSENILQTLKFEPRERQKIGNNYFIMNWVRIVQKDNVEHILKRLPRCPKKGVISDFCFSHPKENIHWHYEIISTKLDSSGMRRVAVDDCQSPTWKCQSPATWNYYLTIEDGAQLFLLKVAMGDRTSNNV